MSTPGAIPAALCISCETSARDLRYIYQTRTRKCRSTVASVCWQWLAHVAVTWTPANRIEAAAPLREGAFSRAAKPPAAPPPAVAGAGAACSASAQPSKLAMGLAGAAADGALSVLPTLHLPESMSMTGSRLAAQCAAVTLKWSSRPPDPETCTSSSSSPASPVLAAVLS